MAGSLPVVGRLDGKSVLVGAVLLFLILKYGDKVPVVGPTLAKIKA
jgi:hypothetical protein